MIIRVFLWLNRGWYFTDSHQCTVGSLLSLPSELRNGVPGGGWQHLSGDERCSRIILYIRDVLYCWRVDGYGGEGTGFSEADTLLP